MKMEYTPDRYKKPIVLDRGIFMGFDYVIVSWGRFPSAYVRIPNGHTLYKNVDNMSAVKCHGGLCYAGSADYLDCPNDCWWVGWHYFQEGDFSYRHLNRKKGEKGVVMAEVDGKKWTTVEIKTEVENVIKQLIKL